MRVAFLTMGRDIGGAAQDILTLSRGLTSLGHQVYVISERGVLDKELEGSGVVFLDAPMYTRSPFGLWRVSRILRKIAFENDLEILNPQGMFTALSGWLATFGLKRTPFTVITTIHMISTFRLYKYSWLLNIFSERVITESNCERNRLHAGGVKRENITVISNSVDMERFSRDSTLPVLRKEYQIPADHFCFGIVARLSPEKRHSDFIAAAREVHAIHPNSSFFIIGDGPLYAAIREEVNGAESYIHMTGRRRDIPDILKSLDAFVLCSEVESLPLSIREAMSMGLPVIATDVGGMREAVLHGVTGLVVPPHQPGKLGEAMKKLMLNPDMGPELGEKGRLFCQISFEVHNWSKKTEAMFLNYCNPNS